MINLNEHSSIEGEMRWIGWRKRPSGQILLQNNKKWHHLQAEAGRRLHANKCSVDNWWMESWNAIWDVAFKPDLDIYTFLVKNARFYYSFYSFFFLQTDIPIWTRNNIAVSTKIKQRKDRAKFRISGIRTQHTRESLTATPSVLEYSNLRSNG